MTTLNIYTDGSCSCNGKINAKAGIGIYIPILNIRYSNNVKNILPEFNIKNIKKYTNNIAELLAILKALKLIDPTKYKIINIYTDSMYSLNSLTKWYKNWEKNGWKTTNGKDVLNKDIFIQILNIIKANKNIKFIHVPAHKSKPKNEIDIINWIANGIVDKLAVEGAKIEK